MANQPLPDVLERNRRDEQQQALRALLMTPLLGSRSAAFPLVRRHQQALRDWLARETGWHLQVEADFARLHKRPADQSDTTRAAATGAVTFTRRRYALLCLLLADLERAEAQITLGRLGESLVATAADPTLADTGLRFALDGRDERRDLVAVVRLLLDMGVLARVAGDEDAFVRQGMDGDVLYDINRRLLASLLVTVRGPSLVSLDGDPGTLEQRLAAISERFVPDTPEGQNQALRQRLTARLLDDPVLYWAELDDDERAYLSSQRSAITRRIEEATGLVAEARAEGLAMVDPQRALTDQHIPAEGTDGHVTLLLAGYLAHTAVDAPVSLDTLAARVSEWSTTYRRYWRRSTQEPGAAHQLIRDAVARLHALRLVHHAGNDAVQARPALARFQVADPRVPTDPQTTLTGTAESP